jgi:CRISPR-associated protein Cas1
VTTPLLNELAQADVPVSYHSYTGWFQGIFRPASGHNVMTRIAQHRVFQDRAAALSLARSFVASKIRNCRVLLRRNAEELPQTVLDLLAELADEAAVAPSHEVLLGKEGAAARFYFENLPRMIRGDLRETFRFDGRNRRPPRDPVNAMLSFSYAMIVRELTGTLHGIGLDPYVGFLHQPRYGRPSLALDLMEEFRPVICDSVVINAVNNGVVQARDFLIHPTGVALTPGGRKKFIQVFERRLDEMANHPTFNTRLSYRRILEVQARLLGKVLRGELPSYPEYRVR